MNWRYIDWTSSIKHRPLIARPFQDSRCCCRLGFAGGGARSAVDLVQTLQTPDLRDYRSWKGWRQGSRRANTTTLPSPALRGADHGQRISQQASAGAHPRADLLTLENLDRRQLVDGRCGIDYLCPPLACPDEVGLERMELQRRRGSMDCNDVLVQGMS